MSDRPATARTQGGAAGRAADVAVPDVAAAPPERTRAASTASADAVARPIVDDATIGDRSGEDVRRRGWLWHWNSVVTQYAPLIGLKGIGLLNSYTVWTDRRDESPHRGYAFPSQ